MRFIPCSASKFIPASHENPQDPGVLKKVLATKETLRDGKVQMINWARLPVGRGFQAHYHEDMQEVFIIITGHAEMAIADESFPATTGDTVIVDPGEVHTMRNVGETEVIYLVIGITSEDGGQTVVVNG